MQDKDRIFTLALVVTIAIFLGVGIAVKQSNDPVLRRIVEQQDKILGQQDEIYQMLTGGSGKAGQGRGNVEMRLASLEKKIDGLLAAVRMPSRPSAPPPDLEEYTRVHKVDIGASQVKGNPDAKVTIVEFADFQCPFCGRFHPVVDEVLAAYPNDVKYVLKHYPLSFHPMARPASKAALAAGEQGKFFEMSDLLLKNGNALSEEKFKSFAGDLGLDVDKFMKDYKDRDAEWEKIIQADMELAQKVDVQGTPTYYINGRKTMARDMATYKKEIDEILGKN
ncbi:MAG: thioredoxin domain-containing protein [Candidatus Omnitrophota bacterium]|nr:thioredoxin domain-containing protein [Candidatus Omnitrophota bacterium]MDZ4242044.1 thioredoxin domain-containing protein [Candidatus Omnitrophota bacterium]